MSGLPGVYDMTLYQGDTCSFDVTYAEAGIGQTLAGAVLSAQIRAKKADASATAVFVVTADADQVANAGKMKVALDAANSELLSDRRYFWDLEIEWPDGRVQTILAGNVTVTQDVTK